MLGSHPVTLTQLDAPAAEVVPEAHSTHMLLALYLPAVHATQAVVLASGSQEAAVGVSPPLTSAVHV